MAQQKRTQREGSRSSVSVEKQLSLGVNPSPAHLLQRAYAAPSSLTAKDVKILQRTIGNRATIGVLSKHSGLQAKLQLGPAGDRYEQEADRVAQQVTRQMDASQPVQRMDEDEELAQAKPMSSVSSDLQRTHAARPKRIFTKPGAGSIAQAKPLAAGISRVQRAPNPQFTRERFAQRQVEEEELQMKPLHGAEGGEVEQSVAQQIGAARGDGKPLDDGVRAKMERGFGADFSGVRVHTGGQADTLNRSLNAKAFTVGNDVFFGKGQYNPGSRSGQKLIAHELTHTVQQGAGVQRKNQEEKIVQRWPWSKKKENEIPERRSGFFSAGNVPELNETQQEPETNIPVATLRLATDKGGGKDVGHSWVELRYDEERAGSYANLINRLPIVEYGKSRLTAGLHDSWGFYPRMFTKNEANKTRMEKRQKAGATPGMGKSLNSSDTGFRQVGHFIKNPAKSEEGEGKKLPKYIWASVRTQGRVEEPDDDHIASARLSYRVTHKQVESMTRYIDSKRDATYSPYRLNCTSFAVGAAKAAGQSPPSGTWFGFSKPRALFDQIAEQKDKRAPNAFVRQGHSLFGGLMGQKDNKDPEAWEAHDFSKKEEEVEN